MELILWRHADAEDGKPDSERKLTAKGVRQAKRMAKWLKLRLPQDTTVIASPAKRALQTVRALTDDFEVATEVGTSGSPDALLTATNWPNQKANTVLVVGHQPTLGETAALLLTGRKEQWGLKKGAIIWLAHREHNGISRIHLRAAISPDLL